MQIRLANEGDIEDIAAMARENMETTRPDLTWDEDTYRRTFWSYIDEASPTFWVAEGKDKIVGFLVADMYGYRATKGVFVTQEVLYVAPAHRGSRAALLLMKELIAWAETLGASEIIGGNDNDFESERTAKFLERFGFERTGYAMRRVVEYGR